MFCSIKMFCSKRTAATAAALASDRDELPDLVPCSSSSSDSSEEEEEEEFN